MHERNFYNSGLRLFRVFGIDVWMHWLLLLLVLYRFYRLWIDPATDYSRWHSLGFLLVWFGVVFLTILLHELGHCYAAYRMGGGADTIVLWPLGGLAYCDAPRIPRAQFWVAAGGPLVNIGLIALFGPIYWFVPIEADAIWKLYVRQVLYALVPFQLFLVFFNLVPMWPLDGGRIFQALVWGRTQSYGRACLYTVWATWVSIVFVAIVSFFTPLRGTFVLIFLIWSFIETRKLQREMQEGEQDYVFGYDFSRGYTSLERTLASEKKRRPSRPTFFEKLRRRRLERAQRKEAELRERLDRLLDKISREGMASLTDRERRFLDEASRKLKPGKGRNE